MIISLSFVAFLCMLDIAPEIVVPESRWCCLGLHVHEPPKKEDRKLHNTSTLEKEKPTELFSLVASKEVDPASVFKNSQLKI